MSETVFKNDFVQNKIAEIFITWKRNFIFHCAVCKFSIHSDLSELLEHVSKQHYDVSPRVEEVYIKEEMDYLFNEVSLDSQYLDLNDTRSTELQREELQMDEPSEDEESPLNQTETDSENTKCRTVREDKADTLRLANTAECQIMDMERSNTSKTEGEPKFKWANANYAWLNVNRWRSRNSCAHSCSQCSKNFRYKTDLTLHNLRFHSDERNFKCQMCDKAFKEKGNFTQHMNRHLGVRKFTCSECEKAFCTSTELKSHTRFQHTNERPFVCELCGQRFVLSGNLADHIKRHTNTRPYKCEFCEKSFYDAFKLRVHSAVHSEERNFACDTCGARFKTAKSKRRHIKKHDVEFSTVSIEAANIVDNSSHYEIDRLCVDDDAL